MSIGKNLKESLSNGRMNVSKALAEKQLRNDDTNTIIKRYSTVTVRLKKKSFLFYEKRFYILAYRVVQFLTDALPLFFLCLNNFGNECTVFFEQLSFFDIVDQNHQNCNERNKTHHNEKEEKRSVKV